MPGAAGRLGGRRADLDRWNGSLLAHHSLVAVEGRDLIVGFGDIDGTGYLDRLYVHKDRQGLGIATALCDRLERAVDAPCSPPTLPSRPGPFSSAEATGSSGSSRWSAMACG